ncbi:MAG: hypothetical protein AW06_002431 [Candidatus Accumulibacter cognatus]|uniref:Uncharacterized protein n=1 Tax=Candidatus Accumulibacter cognatus TaxID=2954383 RepID=A0A080M6A7_9PROT|nr:MAG: hypothetical protein AW06_002431 [Candidatus Accumulibacter cognatus]
MHDTNRVKVRPELLRWARERAWLSIGARSISFLEFHAWESGGEDPIFLHLEADAKAMHPPVG